MKHNLRTFFFILIICTTLIVQIVQAATDYANNTTDYEGEYKSTHNDIQTIGIPEKEPTLEQAGEIRKEKLEQEVAPKPDIDPAQKPDQVLLEKIVNGSIL